MELCRKKGYSGTAIFAKEEALSVRYGLGIEAHDQEIPCDHFRISRIFHGHLLHTPNSQAELKRLAYRMTWEDAFRAYLNELNQENP